jgi:hypothetical protein
MITNYCERFSKKELNECGKQLAFLDNNILGDIRQILEKNPDFKNSIKNVNVLATTSVLGRNFLRRSEPSY